MGLFSIIILFLLCCKRTSTQELLHNPDFENGNSISPWDCQDCHGTVIQGNKYHGASSVRVDNRHHNWAGIAQTFTVQGGHNYQCSAYIKLLNTGNGKAYDQVSAMIKYHANGKDTYIGIGINKYLEAHLPFEEIGGDFHIPSGVNSARLYIQIDDPSVNYILDYASCKQIPHDADWRTHANQRIDNIRKGSLNIRISKDSHVDTNGLSVQIKQTKSKFAFGTAFNANLINDNTHTAYQNWLYNNFEWAVPENAMKWKQMEWTHGHANYARAMDAVTKLKAHGIKVRGHNMFWDIPKHIPDWLSGISTSQLLNEMHKRVNDMLAHSRGTLEHWDVNNENLHGHPFEELTKQPNITQQMFQWMHTVEPNVKLFLNEYNVISSQDTTTAFKNLGKRYKDSGVPIYGMGIQGHFHSSHIDMDILKYRLDKVAQSGLPIWITELTILDPNENTKAAALDNVMTMFVSHPAIEGVLLWGFWDGAVYDTKFALATGNNVTPNAAGKKWQELYHQRFRTSESHSFQGSDSVNSKIFFGEHQLIFKQHGKTIHTENINFDHGGQTATVHIQGTGQNVHVSHVAIG